jgi:hypothetical protein
MQNGEDDSGVQTSGSESLKGRDYFEDLSVDGGITLKQILMKYV